MIELNGYQVQVVLVREDGPGDEWDGVLVVPPKGDSVVYGGDALRRRIAETEDAALKVVLEMARGALRKAQGW